MEIHFLATISEFHLIAIPSNLHESWTRTWKYQHFNHFNLELLDYFLKYKAKHNFCFCAWESPQQCDWTTMILEHPFGPLPTRFPLNYFAVQVHVRNFSSTWNRARVPRVSSAWSCGSYAESRWSQSGRRKRKSVNIFRGTASLKRLSVLTDRQIQGDTQQRFFLKLRRVMYTTRTITCWVTKTLLITVLFKGRRWHLWFWCL